MKNYQFVSTSVGCGMKIFQHEDGEKVDPTMFKSLVESLRYLTCTKLIYFVQLDQLTDIWSHQAQYISKHLREFYVILNILQITAFFIHFLINLILQSIIIMIGPGIKMTGRALLILYFIQEIRHLLGVLRIN